MQRRFPLLLQGLALLLSVTACGGGGKDESGTTPTETTRLEGTVTTSSFNAVDSDVNDPQASYARNDSLKFAQLIPNPAVVGGYLNLPGTGPAGRSQAAGDRSDFYQANLAAGQTVTLLVADADQASQILALWDPADATAPIDETAAGTRLSLTAPADGTWYIEVRAASGASIYNLNVGQAGGLDAPRAARLSDPFVPGELLVSLPGGTRGVRSLERLESLGLRRLAGAPDRLLRLGLPEGEGLRRLLVRLGDVPPGRLAALLSDRKRAVLEVAGKLVHHRLVEAAEPNFIRQAALIPDDSYYSPYQWNLPQINLPATWDLTTGDASVVVAVLDTGVRFDHPDLQGRLLPGYDFISNPATSGDGDGGIDPDPTDVGDQSGFDGSSSFHGTHVSGIVAAATGNGLGVAGIDWQGKVMPVRVLGIGGGTTYDVVQGMYYAAGMTNDSGTVPDNPARVINLSLGGGPYSSFEDTAVQSVIAAGVTVVAAAGNDGVNAPFYPASYDGVIGVSAVGYDGWTTYYSNYGDHVDIAAPGGDTSTDLNGDGYPDGILSTGADDSSGTLRLVYPFMQGTSMAAPHVSAVIGLMMAVHPALDPTDVNTLLTGGYMADDKGDAGPDIRFGYGLLNAYKAVSAAIDLANGIIPGEPGPLLTVAPASVTIRADRFSAEVVLENSGGGNLVVTGATSDAAWLTVEATTLVDPLTRLGTWLLTVDRTGLADGLYSTTVIFTSDANEVQLPVWMTVSSTELPADAGRQYLLLVDTADEMHLEQTEANADESGLYNYRFAAVPLGTYHLFSGSDLDNDGNICDAGESCGAYVTLDNPTRIELQSATTGIDFATGFQPVAPAGAAVGGGALPSRPVRRLR